jgi:hypothetical protein
MTPGSPVTSEMVGRTCPYCRFALEEGVSVIACGVCKAVHHDDCWEENGGCAVALCAGGPSFEAPPQQAPQPAPAQPAAPEQAPLPAVVAPDPSEAPTQKAARPPSTPAPPPPPTPPGAPAPPGRPSRSRWVPLIAAAIVLLGGATATAIVLTKQDKGTSDTAGAGASETTSASAEFEADEFNEEGESEEEEENGFEEEEFEEEEEEEPSPSPAQLAQGQIQHALTAHFNRLASGNYGAAYRDLTSSEGEAIGGESAWTGAQEEDQLESFNLTVETSLTDAHSARATIVDFKTHALATGCNRWFGSWDMSKVYGEWLISSAELEKESC